MSRTLALELGEAYCAALPSSHCRDTYSSIGHGQAWITLGKMLPCHMRLWIATDNGFDACLPGRLPKWPCLGHQIVQQVKPTLSFRTGTHGMHVT